ncbi:Mu transposase C-terminal domain-containing protein [Patulibacter sp. S7RM1-6]
MAEGSPRSLAALPEHARATAMARWETLRPAVEDGVPLTRAAGGAGVALRTAQRWLAAYRTCGLVGLAPPVRSDRGSRRTHPGLVAFVEGLALRRPAPSIAHVHRRTAGLAEENGWRAPSYATVRQIIRGLDPGLTTLAHEGPVAYRDRFELALRWEADDPNAIWQADHTQLDVMILDALGRPARPWLTLILDDYSRAVAGYSVFLEAPSALQTALALRQAVWRKANPAWVICGLPGTLYTDHGSDFVSQHLEQVAANLHVRLTFSTAGVPQGRGKIERIFGSITTELLPTLPGYLAPNRRGTPENTPTLALGALDAEIAGWIGRYNVRPHPETKVAPVNRWATGGWLPRMPDSLEDLDLLLLTVAKARTVHRDGIRFQGVRYVDLTLAAYVGEPVTVRYDPRDLAEIRVFHDERFLCRAVSPELAGTSISLRDLQAARTARRRELRTKLHDRVSFADQLDLPPATPQPPPATPALPAVPPRRIRQYREE